MKLWETYFRLWKKFGDSLTEETKRSLSKEKCPQDDDCITNYYGSVYDKCSGVSEKGICFESGV